MARRKETLLLKSVEMAKARTEMVMRIVAEQSASGIPTTARLKPDVILAAEHYRWLKHLLEHDKLPPEAYIKLNVAEEAEDGKGITVHGG